MKIKQLPSFQRESQSQLIQYQSQQRESEERVANAIHSYKHLEHHNKQKGIDASYLTSAMRHRSYLTAALVRKTPPPDFCYANQILHPSPSKTILLS